MAFDVPAMAFSRRFKAGEIPATEVLFWRAMCLTAV
jgi:hypothetical protein